jgi:hypothetical protein
MLSPGPSMMLQDSDDDDAAESEARPLCAAPTVPTASPSLVGSFATPPLGDATALAGGSVALGPIDMAGPEILDDPLGGSGSRGRSPALSARSPTPGNAVRTMAADCLSMSGSSSASVSISPASSANPSSAGLGNAVYLPSPSWQGSAPSAPRQTVLDVVTQRPAWMAPPEEEQEEGGPEPSMSGSIAFQDDARLRFLAAMAEGEDPLDAPPRRNKSSVRIRLPGTAGAVHTDDTAAADE